MMFNSRIEYFNRLLYLDILTLQYAYLFDSNLNLDYDYSSFSRLNGKINNHSLDVIFKDISAAIDEFLDTSQTDKEDVVGNNISLYNINNESSKNVNITHTSRSVQTDPVIKNDTHRIAKCTDENIPDDLFRL